MHGYEVNPEFWAAHFYNHGMLLVFNPRQEKWLNLSDRLKPHPSSS